MLTGYQSPSAVVGDYGLISATGSSPAPASGIHVGVGSDARGRWGLSGSHSSRRRRTRRVRGHGRFNQGAHKDRAASISSNRWGRCGFRRAGRGAGNVASALAGCLPFVLEPAKSGLRFRNRQLRCRQGACSNQIWTLRADISRSFASCARSSVDGNAVRV